MAMHYGANTLVAFSTVEQTMRDVNAGWLMRYAHANGASFFFIVVYLHIFRGLYFGSYKAPREMVWLLGLVIFLLMMATAFMGRSEEHTSELQSLMRISYAVFCLKKKKN